MEEQKLNKVEKLPGAYDMPPAKEIIPPKEGWKNGTFYLVCASFSSTNPCHEYIFYTGFVNDGVPCGYNQFFYGSDQLSIGDVYYMHVVKELHQKDTVDLTQKI